MFQRVSSVFALSLLIALFSACAGDDTTGQGNSSNNTIVNNTNNVNNGDMGSGNNTNNSNNQNNVDTDTGMTPDPCDGNTDCTPPEICVFDAVTGDSTCQESMGGAVGDACMTGADCASGLCINGACAAPCGGEDDCPVGYMCEDVDVSLDGGGSVSIGACIPEPDPCLSNANCTNGDLCTIDRSTTMIALECGTAVGGGDLGANCAADGECQSGLCIDGACARPCERPNDCSTDGSYICDTVTVPLDGGGDADVNLCQPRPGDICLADSECTNAGELCVATRTATDVEFRCGTPNAGGDVLGGTCAADTECANNLCVDGVCVAPCQGNGDCVSATDFTCELTAVDLGAGNTDNASICVPPVDCDENDDCKINEVCFVRDDAGTRDLICRVPNVGGGDLGNLCLNDRECANNLCLDTRFRDVCTEPCFDNTDCSVPGYECQAQMVGGMNVNICAPATPTACLSNDDCPTRTTCAVIVNAAATGLESVCVPETGGDATAVACQDDTDCASLVCLGGFCAAPCEDSTQCGGGQLCSSQSVSKDGQTGTFDLCETLADEACVDTSSCSDGVRVCSSLIDVMGTVTPFCAFPNTSAPGQLGSSCMSASECRENVCLTVSDECTVVCNDDTDCGASQGCTTYSVQGTDVNFCNSVCSDDGDCGANRICTINRDVIANDVDLVCENTAGVEDLGSPCATGGECITGLCLNTQQVVGTTACTVGSCASGQSCECPVGNPSCAAAELRCVIESRACTRICDDSGDCATSTFASNELTACSPNTVVQRPNGGTKNVSTCGRP